MKILLVGVSARAMAESAVGSGYAVVALDAFGDVDLQALCEAYSLRRDFDAGPTAVVYSAQALARASRQLEFDAVAYSANFENFPEMVQTFSRRCPVLGNPPKVLERVRYFPTLFDTLASAGFSVPETFYKLNGKHPDSERAWLLKPLRGGGGQHVGYWQPGRPLPRGFLLQERLPGPACSAQFIANGQDAVVIGLTEQLIGCPEFGAHGFHYCGNLLPLEQRTGNPSVLDQVQQIAARISRDFGLVGANGFDFILANGRVCTLEVNPRYTAAMELVELAYGLSVFDLHVQAVTTRKLPSFDLTQATPLGSRFYGKAILYAEKEARAPDTHGWPDRGRRDVPHPGENLASGKPICTLLASANTRDGCFANLAAGAESIKGEIYA